MLRQALEVSLLDGNQVEDGVEPIGDCELGNELIESVRRPLTTQPNLRTSSFGARPPVDSNRVEATRRSRTNISHPQKTSAFRSPSSLNVTFDAGARPEPQNY
jgi:hypothetical protein